MRVLLPWIFAILLPLSLAACAEHGATRPESASPPPATSSEKVPPPPAPDEVVDGQAAPPPQAGAEAPEKPREPSEDEIADCYRYARATIEHDRSIERDRGDAIGFGSLGSDVGAVSAQISRVGEASTYNRAYRSCMRSKGYGEQ